MSAWQRLHCRHWPSPWANSKRSCSLPCCTSATRPTRPPVRSEIERRARRPVSRGAVYVTLDRLETKRFLISRVGEDDTGQIARARRYYHATPKGVRAVRRALARRGAHAHRARAAAQRVMTSATAPARRRVAPSERRSGSRRHHRAHRLGRRVRCRSVGACGRARGLVALARNVLAGRRLCRRAIHPRPKMDPDVASRHPSRRPRPAPSPARRARRGCHAVVRPGGRCGDGRHLVGPALPPYQRRPRRGPSSYRSG